MLNEYNQLLCYTERQLEVKKFVTHVNKAHSFSFLGVAGGNRAFAVKGNNTFAIDPPYIHTNTEV